MLSIVTKILIGTAVVVGTGVVVAAVTKSKEEAPETKDSESKAEEKEGFIKRIKKAVSKKVIRILAWVAVHAEQIEAASTVVGFATGVVGIISAIKEFRRGSTLEKRVVDLDEKMNYLISEYNSDMDDLFDRMEHIDIVGKEAA